MSVDPLYEAFSGHSPYHYAFNSPLIFRDPTGLAPEEEEKKEQVHGGDMLGWVMDYLDYLSSQNLNKEIRHGSRPVLHDADREQEEDDSPLLSGSGKKRRGNTMGISAPDQSSSPNGGLTGIGSGGGGAGGSTSRNPSDFISNWDCLTPEQQTAVYDAFDQLGYDYFDELATNNGTFKLIFATGEEIAQVYNDRTLSSRRYSNCLGLSTLNRKTNEQEIYIDEMLVAEQFFGNYYSENGEEDYEMWDAIGHELGHLMDKLDGRYYKANFGQKENMAINRINRVRKKYGKPLSVPYKEERNDLKAIGEFFESIYNWIF
jgi:hypothetical protein